MKKIGLILVCYLGCLFIGQAQTDTTRADWRLFPGKDGLQTTTDTLKQDVMYVQKSNNFKALDDSAYYYNPSKDGIKATSSTGNVTVDKDPRIEELLSFLGTEDGNTNAVKIDGFRVQVFFDQNRDLALGEKARFMSSFDVPAYMEWDAPNHYVRAGNFYTKQQALVLIDELKGAFPTATVIKCKIELPEIED